MGQASLLHDLAIVFAVAACVITVFSRLRLPVVLGYILTGFLIGPHFTFFTLVSDEANIHILSELGMVFLLFSLGLEFNLHKLRRVGAAAVLAGLVEIGGMVTLGNIAGRFMGWSQSQSMFLGAVLAISSTTIIVKVFMELQLKKETFADMVYGMLIVEDLAAVLLLTLLSGAATGPSLFNLSSFITLGYLLVFLITSLVLGLLVVPKLTRFAALLKNDETLLITVLGLCLGFCILVSSMGYSVALGAFLMGAILASTKAISRIEKLIAPLRDLFCAVFFVSVGLQLKPASLVENPGTILFIFLVLIIGKTLLCSFGAFISGKDFASSLKVGMSMAQIGEFSFVIAALGVSQRVISESVFSVVVSVSVISTITTPLFILSSERIARFLLRRFPAILLSYIDLYYNWTLRFAERSRSDAVQNILKRITVKLTVFAGLIAAAFFVALFLSRVLPAFINIPAKYIPWLETSLWLTAILVSMPVILPAIKKMKALGMILAELGITKKLAGNRYQEIRSILSNIFLLLGVGLLILYGGLLSSTILPTWNLLFLLAAVIVVLAFFLRDAFANIYVQGLQTLNRNLEREEVEEGAGGLAPPGKPEQEQISFQTSRTFHIKVGKDAPMAGSLIRDTRLRSRTGVSILAIERVSGLIINPGPEEEILEEDALLLLGNPSQLAEARLQFESKKNPHMDELMETPLGENNSKK